MDFRTIFKHLSKRIMKPFLIISLIFTLSLNAQEGMVLIRGDVSHQIDVPDALTKQVVERWKFEMKAAGIQFQAPLRNIKSIEFIERDYHWFGEIKGGVIYLNKALNEYPYCKRAAILQMLYVNQGGKIDKQTRPLAISNFKVTMRTNAVFERQFEHGYIYSYLIQHLKK